ncbi:hypothetical protein A7U60_g6668 [Sanghuangporus baumii]|uniref:Galactose-1-phosphate uridylyltransferase n=1 Tax=Sanghuangporus baumii TaxID=108892 RepID=A0A9Q5HUR0_SANBA|nr:hypothetical protein A7U60_g6668 [Sanghuangporus baumii]
MDEFDPTQHPHRRYNPLTDEYILVSPHRARRPWLGQVEPSQPPSLPQYDPACYLCPGNKRAGGIVNDAYTSTFIFPNDFAALTPAPVPAAPEPPHSLLNKGAMMGCSNPHPHCQVWSMSDIPTIPGKELASFKRYASSESDVPASDAPKAANNRPCLLCEYAHFEVNGSSGERIVTKNDDWVALVPWWATWPFELLVLPYRRHIRSISDLTPEEKSDFARILSEVTIRYDNLFFSSFPYSMGIHQGPISLEAAQVKKDCEDDCEVPHLHLHFAPPLLRSATVRKFLVGFELMAEAQRDLTPEQGASRLRECGTKHYADSL